MTGVDEDRPEMSLPESIGGWKGRGVSRPEAKAGQDLAPPPDIASGGYGRSPSGSYGSSQPECPLPTSEVAARQKTRSWLSNGYALTFGIFSEGHFVIR